MSAHRHLKWLGLLFLTSCQPVAPPVWTPAAIERNTLELPMTVVVIEPPESYTNYFTLGPLTCDPLGADVTNLFLLIAYTNGIYGQPVSIGTNLPFYASNILSGYYYVANGVTNEAYYPEHWFALCAVSAGHTSVLSGSFHWPWTQTNYLEVAEYWNGERGYSRTLTNPPTSGNQFWRVSVNETNKVWQASADLWHWFDLPFTAGVAGELPVSLSARYWNNIEIYTLPATLP